MSEIKVNSIKGVGASVAALSINNSDGTCTANITNNLSNRNLIINGAAQINQRGNQTGISSGGTNYTLDRWSLSLVNGGTWNISQSTDTPDGFGNSIKLECTTADTSLGASDYLLFRQKIEGQNVQGFAKGTSSAKQFVLSFYVKSNKSGVYTVELRDNDNSRTCAKTFTVSNSNWNRYTLIFPADTTGVFDNNNEDSLQLNIWLASGTDRTSGTLQTAWGSQTNANRVSSSNVNLADNTSNEWYLTGVQLEVDQTGSSVATDFEHKSVGLELQLCKRYFEKITLADYPMQPNGSNGVNSMTFVPYSVEKRASATVTADGGFAFWRDGHNVGATPSFGGNVYGATIFAGISGANYGSSTMVRSGTFLASSEL